MQDELNALLLEREQLTRRLAPRPDLVGRTILGLAVIAIAFVAFLAWMIFSGVLALGIGLGLMAAVLLLSFVTAAALQGGGFGAAFFFLDHWTPSSDRPKQVSQETLAIHHQIADCDRRIADLTDKMRRSRAASTRP